jgi:hypothetical protein
MYIRQIKLNVILLHHYLAKAYYLEEVHLAPQLLAADQVLWSSRDPFMVPLKDFQINEFRQKTW